jgi:RHS repeat-associated protein
MHLTGGALKAVGETVGLVRMLNPTDPYNLTHPGQYLQNVNGVLTGLASTVAHPERLVGVIAPVAQAERALTSDTQQAVDTRFFAIITDLVGTPTELVTPDGDLAWRTRSTLWGTTAVARDATAHTPLRHPGQYADIETGLHYNHHRHYGPATARCTSPDPLGLGPAPNPVAWVTDPHTWTDPLGLFTCKVEKALKDWQSNRYQFGNNPYQLDKSGMAHILDRHHPECWDGSVKANQSFFDRKNDSRGGGTRHLRNAEAEQGETDPTRQPSAVFEICRGSLLMWSLSMP